MDIEIGNLNQLEKDHPEQGGWCVGSFIDSSSLRHSDVCEVKWAHHPKGLKKPSGLNLHKPSRTIVSLVSGKIKLVFLDEGKEIILSEPGEYVVFDGMRHETECLEDTEVMVVRWYPVNE